MTDSLIGKSTAGADHSLQLTRYNPPGQTELLYRPGVYSLIVSRMLDELRKQKVTAQTEKEKDSQPLIHFNTLARNDWTVAFLRAWATVSDVLSFYQERIINEGYLRTALERRSVLELTRAVGYELSPPVSATTYLAFSVHEAFPGKEIMIPRGTAVQSIPDPFSSSNAIQDIVQGQASPAPSLPVIFETTDDLIADAAWNALMPSRILGLSWPKGNQEKSRTLRLAGSTLGLKPGDALLITGQPESAWELLLLSKVDSQAKEGYTAVSWEGGYGAVPAEGIADPSVYVFRRKTTLFPYVAGAVFRRTDLGWSPTNIGLPPKAVQAAAASSEGRLYVGIEQAVYSSGDRGDSWQPLASGLPPKDVHAIATGPSGGVAVGTDDSGVHVSNDGGQTWSPLSGPDEVEIPTGWRRFIESVRYKLPKTKIRSLLYTERGETRLLAGSDDGVFGYDARQDSWISMNEHFPDLDRKKGTAPLSVRALAAVDGCKRILAGTDNGVFRVEALFNGPSSALLAALLIPLLAVSLHTTLPDFLSKSMGQIIKLLANIGISIPLEPQYILGFLIPFGILIVLLVWQPPFRPRWVGVALTIALYVISGTPILWSSSDDKYTEFTYLVQNLIVLFLAWDVLRAALSRLPGLVQKSPDWLKKLLPRLFAEVKHPKVLSLLAVGAAVYAGTDHGIYELDKQTWTVRFIRWWRRLLLGPEPEPWTRLPAWYAKGSDPAGRVVTALALDKRGRLLAGTQTGNLYVRLRGPAQTWTAATHLPLSSIRAIVTANKDTFAMGEPLDAPQETLWAPAHLEAGAVDVDALSLTVPVNSFAVAIDNERSALYRVTAAMEQASCDAKRPGQLTRLKVSDKKSLPCLNRARTLFFCQSESLAFFDDQFRPHPVQGDQIDLLGKVTGLLPGKVLLISGKDQDGQQCSEPVIIKVAVPGETKTSVYLERSLANVYDRDSVTVYGNIVPAIQGRTIRKEYLGESDGTISNQRFILSSPLAYEPAEANDYESSLTVLVNNIQWNQVPTLLDQPAGGRVFMVRRNGPGQTVIIFGDGGQGARLPTSREILTATYRSGVGEAGNLPAHSLTMLQSHLPHVKSVTNPGPAQGGLSAESGEHGRKQAPKRVRALDRIVTLKDYADFAATFPGVSKAATRAMPENAPRWIDIALVPKYNLQSDSSQIDILRSRLEKAISASRNSTRMPFKLRVVQPVLFSLGMKLYVSPAMRQDEDRTNKLIQAVCRKILEMYSLDSQVLGHPITETEIFKLVQSVHGVTAVALTRFQKHTSIGGESESSVSVFALTANWDELLLIEEKDLDVEVGS